LNTTGVTNTVTEPVMVPAKARMRVMPGRCPRTVPSAFVSVAMVVSVDVQLTATLGNTLPAESRTTALNCSVSSAMTVADSGVTVTLAGGAAGGG